jgi:hypothetical protein
MTEIRLKEKLAMVLSWWAFMHLVWILTLPVHLVLFSKSGMFESAPSLYERVITVYADFLELGPGPDWLWYVTLPPFLWLSLWAMTGSVRFFPWKNAVRQRDG